MSEVTLVLNKDAMDALFPEGSEARLILATAAIKKMAETAIKPTMVSAEVMAVIEKQRKQAVEEVLQMHGCKGWSKFEFKHEFLNELRQQATAAVNGACSAAIDQAVTNAMDSIVTRVDNMLMKRVTAATNTKVSEAVQQIVEQYTSSITPE